MKLFKHQSEGIRFFIKTKNCAFYFDVGLGKTLTALMSFIELMKSVDGELKLLIVCPISLIESAWADDIKKYTKLTYENLRISQTLKADILIVNYEMLISAKFQPTLLRILKLRPMCVLDECQKIKSYNAKTTKLLLKASPYFPYKVIMSATPAPNIESEYWSQMCFLDPIILGDNFFKFRNRFMCLVRGAARLPLIGLSKQDIIKFMQRGYAMALNPDTANTMRWKMKPYCMYIEKREALDLPEEVDVKRIVAMDPGQRKAYTDMFRDMVTQIKEEQVSVPNALAKLMKLRQITGGFIYGDSEQGAIEFDKNPKMQELQEVIEEIGRKKIVVFCQYQWEIERIASLFVGRASTLYGKTHDRDSVIRHFKESTDGILVTHPLSGGVGLSFNDTDYSIFYSLSYSFLEYYQSRGRIMRAGKINKATYIHLIAEKSIDGIIMEALQRKHSDQELFRRIMG